MRPPGGRVYLRRWGLLSLATCCFAILDLIETESSFSAALAAETDIFDEASPCPSHKISAYSDFATATGNGELGRGRGR